jgi:hypothetical protein
MKHTERVREIKAQADRLGYELHQLGSGKWGVTFTGANIYALKVTVGTLDKVEGFLDGVEWIISDSEKWTRLHWAGIVDSARSRVIVETEGEGE